MGRARIRQAKCRSTPGYVSDIITSVSSQVSAMLPCNYAGFLAT